MTGWDFAASGAIGLGAGVLGGLAGVGGSILMLPALGILLGYPTATAHHGYMAAAMTTNVAVAIPAALRHARENAVRKDLLGTLIPATAVALAIGVLCSNLFPGWHLMILLGVFLLVYSGVLLYQAFHRRPDHHADHEAVTKPKLIFSASATGLTAGLLGLGGGGIQVPLLQSLCKIPLRQAIATSSAVICLTAAIGAVLKLATLPTLGEPVWPALGLAASMIPGAIAGGWIGASLAHSLPLGWVRTSIAVILSASAVRLIVSAGKSAGWWG